MQQRVEERPLRDASKFNDTLAVGSRYGTIWMLRAATGEVAWRHVSGEKLGSLIHTGDTIYFSSHDRQPVRKQIDLPPALRPKAMADRPFYVTAQPGYITALRASDGEMLWRREGWMMYERPPFAALDGDLLITDNLAPEIGETIISAVDIHTGEIRWTYHTGEIDGPVKRLIAVRAGRVYVRRGGREDHQIHVLDAQTGDEVWSREFVDWWPKFSSGGKLVSVTSASTPASKPQQLILATADGTLVAEQPNDSTLLALTDDGIAYLTRRYRGVPRIWAARIDDPSEIWLTRDLEVGNVIATDTVLYYGLLTQPRYLAQVGALDARTGKSLWRWHSPGNIFSLLKLWGWRTPDMAAFALAQARRSLAHSRESHDRGIFTREVVHGQWRRPGALIGNIQITVGNRRVYVVTNLGIFALNARNGHLLWHALPTSDLSLVTPALPLEL